MSFRECLDRSGWNLRGKIREALDWFMFDFENAASAENISAWQSSYSGIGKVFTFCDSNFHVDTRDNGVSSLQKGFTFESRSGQSPKSNYLAMMYRVNESCW